MAHLDLMYVTNCYCIVTDVC